MLNRLSQDWNFTWSEWKNVKVWLFSTLATLALVEFDSWQMRGLLPIANTLATFDCSPLSLAGCYRTTFILTLPFCKSTTLGGFGSLFHITTKDALNALFWSPPCCFFLLLFCQLHRYVLCLGVTLPVLLRSYASCPLCLFSRILFIGAISLQIFSLPLGNPEQSYQSPQFKIV